MFVGMFLAMAFSPKLCDVIEKRKLYNLSIMIADRVDYDEYRTGHHPDGVFFSGQSFMTNLGAGISSIIQSAVYTAVGFSNQNKADSNEIIMNVPKMNFCFATDPRFEAYRFGIFFLVSTPPLIGLALAVIPTLKYEIINAEHTRIPSELSKRRNGEIPASQAK